MLTTFEYNPFSHDSGRCGIKSNGKRSGFITDVKKLFDTVFATELWKIFMATAISNVSHFSGRGGIVNFER